MDESLVTLPIERVEGVILLVRGEKIILDKDLAELYGVETRALVQAVKRNSERFPNDFMFRLTTKEFASLRSQIVNSEGKGGWRPLPYVFTKHGVFHGSERPKMQPRFI